jgi:hypothetical protein
MYDRMSYVDPEALESRHDHKKEFLLTVAVAILIVAIAVAFVALLAYALRSAGESAERSVEARSPVPRRPVPIVTDFHVNGDTASTVFAVPLGEAEAGDHLVELLCASAVEYLRLRKQDGLPLDGVRHIEVSAMRGDTPEVLGTVDLPEVGMLPDPDEKVLVEPSHDPIAAVHEVIADARVAPQSESGTSLEPIARSIELSGPTDAHLRSIGVDPDTMSLDDLVLGLLRVSGYDVHVGRTGMTDVQGGRADIFGLTRDGKTTMLLILSHEDGSHPELDDSVLAKFAIGFSQSSDDQAILVTDKYSPYAMYEREKRDPRCVYITRERLQTFVDSFGLT